MKIIKGWVHPDEQMFFNSKEAEVLRICRKCSIRDSIQMYRLQGMYKV